MLCRVGQEEICGLMAALKSDISLRVGWLGVLGGRYRVAVGCAGVVQNCGRCLGLAVASFLLLPTLGRDKNKGASKGRGLVKSCPEKGG